MRRLEARVRAQGGTVLDKVAGRVDLDGEDAEGGRRRGPVLVLKGIDAGAELHLTRPRPVIVMGQLSGRIFGAYRVQAGSLLSGRIEGARHVEVTHDMGSHDDDNVDAWIVFEATSDPGYLRSVQALLARLRDLERCQQPQREAAARRILLESVRDVPYEFAVFGGDTTHSERAALFRLRPGRQGREIELDTGALLRHIRERSGEGEAQVQRAEACLREEIAASLRQANANGAIRRGAARQVPRSHVDAVYQYLAPKLFRLWRTLTRRQAERALARLGSIPMELRVGGQLAPFWQIEYPHWRFEVVAGKLVQTKVADCNIACQKGAERRTMNLTYSYVGDAGWFTQSVVLPYEQARACRLILRDGRVYLQDESRLLFQPEPDPESGS